MPELAWFKSSYSDGPDGDSCVEIVVAPRQPGRTS